MKVSDRNEVVIEGVVRRNRSLSGDAAADLDIQIQSRHRPFRRRKGKGGWQHNRFDVRMSGPKAKARLARVRRGCIVRVSGQLRSTDLPESKPYIEAKEIEVLGQPASQRSGRRRKPKAKKEGSTFRLLTPEEPQNPGEEKPPLPSGASAPSAQVSDQGDAADEGATEIAASAGTADSTVAPAGDGNGAASAEGDGAAAAAEEVVADPDA